MPSRSLHDLLPDVYRTRDAEKDNPLRALLELVAADLDNVERDLAHLYDDWFIENSASWMLVYVGELLGRIPRATRFAVSPVVDEDGLLSDFQLHTQTFRLHRVCWEDGEGGREAIGPAHRVEVESTANGASASFLTYLDVWERLVTPVEDDQTTQIALGGPDTGERTRTIQEVRFGELVPGSGSGYQRLENQLYRIEVHDGAAGADSHGFAWSRGNGAIVGVLNSPTTPCSH